MTPPLNDSVTNPPLLSSVCQQSFRSSQNKTPELHASSLPGGNSANLSNTIPPPSTKNGSRNIYGYMVGGSKWTLEKLQQHSVMLLQYYHGLCNTNEPSSMFVSPPPIPNIESLSQSTISSLGCGSFGKNISDVNIQLQTTLKLSDTETTMVDND